MKEPHGYIPEDKQERRVCLEGGKVFCLEKVRKITVLETTIAVAKTKPCEHIPEDIVARPDRKPC